MPQGSFTANSTTVNFTEISPVGIPGLMPEGRYQNPPGTAGGLYIKTNQGPRTFTKQVLAEGTWADSADKAYETLLGLARFYDDNNLLTVHSQTEQKIILDDVELLSEMSDGTNVVHQVLSISFTRFQ